MLNFRNKNSKKFLLIGMSGFFGGFMAMIGLIFPVLFIILYGLNVKHMA